MQQRQTREAPAHVLLCLRARRCILAAGSVGREEVFRANQRKIEELNLLYKEQ